MQRRARCRARGTAARHRPRGDANQCPPPRAGPCASQSSPTSTETCPALEAVLAGDRRARRRTSSGASATSSATARGRTSAADSCASAPTLCLVGNHDLGVLGRARPRRVHARRRARRRAGRESVLGADERARSSTRSSRRRRARASSSSTRSPRDPVWEYVLTEDVGAAALRADDRADRARRSQPCPARPRSRGGTLAGGLAPGGTEMDLADGRWLLNPGSVGQPRDGDPRAAWLLLDHGRRQRLLPAGRVRRRGGPRPRSATRACRMRWRRGSRRARSWAAPEAE